MNAFGDATFALALFLLIQHTGQLDMPGVFTASPHSGTVANLIALGLLGGAVAKSAQIPLHTWLPDAMEGPTPVSALIHAATMVTAGVYLIVRTHVLFQYAPHVQDAAAALGALTLLMAGLIALVQTDIKRVIAYSTMSQIGYMFVAAGIGAYSAAMFHLMTHAFFKALLFLAAGIIIHALTGEQDIRRMGGLGKAMPHTQRAFFVGALALVGIPPFAGFFSKDGIVDATLARGDWFGYLMFAACVAGAFLTGLYTFRLFFIVFGGEQLRVRPGAPAHARGQARRARSRWSGRSRVLTVLSVIGGWIQFAPFWEPLNTWLAPVAPSLTHPSNLDDGISFVAALLAGLGGIYVAWLAYSKKSLRVPKPVKLFEKKFYWDELYDAVFYKPADLVSRGLGRFFELPVIAGSLGEVTQGFRFGSGELARAQNGLVRAYVLALTSGVAILAVVFIATR